MADRRRKVPRYFSKRPQSQRLLILVQTRVTVFRFPGATNSFFLSRTTIVAVYEKPSRKTEKVIFRFGTFSV